MHLALKVIGSRNVRLKGTATVYAYLVGVGAPLMLACYYPLVLLIGPKAVFGTAADVGEIALVLSQSPGILAYSSPIQFAFAAMSGAWMSC
jgi:hypothetical protein